MSDSNPKASASRELNKFGQQLDDVESFLHSTSECNDQLTILLDNLQKLVKKNGCIVNHLQSNGQRIESLLKGLSDQKPTAHHIKRKINLPEFKGAKTQCRPKVPEIYSQSSVSQQLRELGSKVNTIGKKFQLLRNTALMIKQVTKEQDASPRRRACEVANKRQICWMPCNHSTEDQRQTRALTELKKERRAVLCSLQNHSQNHAVISLPNFASQQQLTMRVKDILANAKQLNLNSVVLTDVKVLCEMVLQALYKRTDVYQMYSNKNPYI